MLSTNRNLILWIIAIAFVIVNQLLVLSISTYEVEGTFGKMKAISIDTLVAIIVGVVAAIVLTLILALVPYGELNYQNRFRQLLSLALIVVQLITAYMIFK